MGKDKKKQLGVLGLIIALIVVLFGGLIFMGAVAGWFDDPKVMIDEEYLNEQPVLKDAKPEDYNSFIDAKSSFIVFVDQDGCTTADRLRGYMNDYINEKGVTAYRMMFEDMKETSLHDFVKYYPSVAIINKGEVKYYLRADSDEDAEMYNDYNVFKNWMDERVGIPGKTEMGAMGHRISWFK